MVKFRKRSRVVRYLIQKLDTYQMLKFFVIKKVFYKNILFKIFGKLN